MDCGARPVSAAGRRDVFPATVAAHRWNGALFALPWFVDVGMLYWRTDLVPAAPRDLDELVRMAGDARTARDRLFGFVWQGARYEGLVADFLEHLGAFGGAIMDERRPRASWTRTPPWRRSRSCATPFTAMPSSLPRC